MRLAVLGLLLVISTDLYAQRVAADHPDLTFEVEDVKFTVSDIRLVQDGSSLFFLARVRHDDEYDWTALFLNVTLLDRRGNVLHSPTTAAWARGLNAGQAVHVRQQFVVEGEPHGMTVEVDQATYDIENKLEIRHPEGASGMVFEDDNIHIGFSLGREGLSFSLQNKTTAPIRINWDDAAFVTPEGESSRLIHSGVALSESDAQQSPGTVAPRARLTEVLIPVAYIRHSRTLGWDTSPILPGVYPAAEGNLGKSIGLYLPLQMRSETLDYFFELEVVEVHRRR